MRRKSKSINPYSFDNLTYIRNIEGRKWEGINQDTDRDPDPNFE